jgi:hypothetical protein
MSACLRHAFAPVQRTIGVYGVRMRDVQRLQTGTNYIYIQLIFNSANHI